MSDKVVFADLSLDARLLRALDKKGYVKPTPVQSEVVPKALEGKDIVARARTGTGKTMAYLLPAFHSLLAASVESPSFQVLVLVPTSELCEQVREEAHSLAVHCAAGIKVTALTNEATDQARKIAVANAGQIVISTPGRVAIAIRDGTLPASRLSENLKVLIVDEADLLLSFGYEGDIRELAVLVPRSCQCILMSATTSADVERLSKLVLYNPIALDLTKLTPGGGSAAAVEHYHAKVAAADRLLAVLVILRLHLVKRKVLLFVNSIDMAYRLRLFLEAFGQKAAVLNATLPLNSRHHIIQQFNRDLFDLLIATDDVTAEGSAASRTESNATASTSAKIADKSANSKAKKGGEARRRADAAEFGVTRGIDFKGVRSVINVELPSTLQGYTHRVGRTGRAGQSGLALSICTDKDQNFLDELQSMLGAGTATDGDGDALAPFMRLKPDALDALRYRAQDVLHSLTKAVLREAQSRDLKLEILNSSKLQDFFEAHESDARVLQHDKTLNKTPQRVKHLRQLPDYIKASAGIQGGKQRKGNPFRGTKRKLRPEDDPLKGKVTFQKDNENELTDMEEKAMKLAKKAARKAAKTAAVPVVPKRNVRKRR